MVTANLRPVVMQRISKVTFPVCSLPLLELEGAREAAAAFWADGALGLGALRAGARSGEAARRRPPPRSESTLLL
eukprot:12058968-Alexandrium_andersonii.AAC.1